MQSYAIVLVVMLMAIKTGGFLLCQSVRFVLLYAEVNVCMLLLLTPVVLLSSLRAYCYG